MFAVRQIYQNEHNYMWWQNYVYPTIDSQVLLFPGCLGEQCISSRYWVSLRCCGHWFCHFSFTPLCQWRESCCGERRGESGWSPRTSCFWRSWPKGWRRCEEGRYRGEDVVFVYGAPALAISGFESEGLSSQRSSEEKDWREKLCLHGLVLGFLGSRLNACKWRTKLFKLR